MKKNLNRLVTTITIEMMCLVEKNSKEIPTMVEKLQLVIKPKNLEPQSFRICSKVKNSDIFGLASVFQRVFFSKKVSRWRVQSPITAESLMRFQPRSIFERRRLLEIGSSFFNNDASSKQYHSLDMKEHLEGCSRGWFATDPEMTCKFEKSNHLSRSSKKQN